MAVSVDPIRQPDPVGEPDGVPPVLPEPPCEPALADTFSLLTEARIIRQ